MEEIKVKLSHKKGYLSQDKEEPYITQKLRKLQREISTGK